MSSAKATHQHSNSRSLSHEHVWTEILLHLHSPSSSKALHELGGHYQQLVQGGRTPRSTFEREAFAHLKQAVSDFVYSAIARTRERASQDGSVAATPCITSVSIREEFFTIKETGEVRELCMLVQLQDALGRTSVFSDGLLSYPTRNPMLIYVRCKDWETFSFDYDVLFSRSAFLEEIEVVRLLLDPFNATHRRKALLPVTYFAIERAALSACGVPPCQNAALTTCMAATIDNITVIDRGMKEVPAFLVHVSWGAGLSQRCLVRFGFSAELPFPITRTTLLADEGFA